MAVKSQKVSESTDIIAPIKQISDFEPIFDRKKLLEITSSVIEEIAGRVCSDRFKVSKADQVRLAYIKSLRDFVVLYSSLLKDADAPPLEGYKKPVSLTDSLVFPWVSGEIDEE